MLIIIINHAHFIVHVFYFKWDCSKGIVFLLEKKKAKLAFSWLHSSQYSRMSNLLDVRERLQTYAYDMRYSFGVFFLGGVFFDTSSRCEE